MPSSETAIKQLKKISSLGRKMRLAAEEWPSEFQTLISIILSARSLDEITIKYATILFEKFPDAESLSKAQSSEVEKIIFPINFYQNKSKYIIQCAKELLENYGGKIPHNMGELIKLPGVGRKTANVFLSEMNQKALGVDTHVTYISRYLGWTDHPENAPQKIEEDLKKLFPKEMWSQVNPSLVRFGKTYVSRSEKNKILDEIKRIK
jgi:endonuclease-3